MIMRELCLAGVRSLTARHYFAIFCLVLGLQTAQAQTSIVVVGAGTQAWGGCYAYGTWSTNDQAAQAAFTQCGYAGWEGLTLGPCVPPVPVINQGAGCAIYAPWYPSGPVAGLSTQLQEQSTGSFWTQASSLFHCPKNPVGPDPIDPGSGDVFECDTDGHFSGASPIRFKRYYNSASSAGTDFGPGWQHSYSQSIVATQWLATPTYPPSKATFSPQYPSAAQACTSGFAAVQAAVPAWSGASTTYTANGICVISNSSGTIGTLPIYSGYSTVPGSMLEYDIIRPSGDIYRFTQQNGVIVPPPGISVRFAVTGSGFMVTDDDDNVETYNMSGVLQSITSRDGVVQTLTYSSGFLNGVTDSFGNTLTLNRNTNNEITSVVFGSAGTVQYSYDSSLRLSQVTELDGTTIGYLYQNTNFPNALTGKVDENGTQYLSWGYDSFERGTSNSMAGGAMSTSVTYNSNATVTVTDALGEARAFSYGRIGDFNQATAISGSQCATCEEMAGTIYDASGWVASRTDYNGNLTCYANDPVRGLELVRVEGFAPSSTCPSSLSTYTPQSGTLQRKITTVWNSTWREPSTITEPNRTTLFIYDGYGNVLTKTVTDTSVSPNVSRTWTYKYFNSGLYGQVQTATSPRTDITTDVTNYTYYNCTSGGDCGQVDTVTNGLNQVTTFTSYNAYGQPLTITDPNGVVTTLTYDARERLTSKQVGTETTSFSYWPIGLVKLVTLPDSSTLQFTYDGAHRLTTITDGVGNYISYTLDALGNRTAENWYDPTSTLRRTHTRVFNNLSQLYQDINAAGTSTVTTTLGYDSQGNLTSSDAPLSRNTSNQYDALNRLDQITDPNSGITVLGYDANDNLATVKDPRTFTTTYSHDGFNEVTQQASPDTGTTKNTFDSAGNLKTVTDARNALGTYSYDALNRLTQAQYADQTINYTYDTGTNGKGRLTGASDANHTLAWTYDTHGRVTGKSQIVGSVTKSVGYGYTHDDLTSIVTPSGQTITYAYTNHQISSITVNSTTLLSGATYAPFGPVTGWTWGNSTTVGRTYDEDYKITAISTASDPIDFATTTLFGSLESQIPARARIAGRSTTTSWIG
jgi:YD repeat-containing protein